MQADVTNTRSKVFEHDCTANKYDEQEKGSEEVAAKEKDADRPVDPKHRS